MKRSGKAVLAVCALVVAMLATMRVAGDAGFWRRYVAAAAAGEPLRESVRGGDGGSMPRAAPADQDMDAAALELAADWAGQHAAHALLVSRNGHLIFERYWQGSGDDRVPDSRGLSAALLALVTGAVAAEVRTDPDVALQELRQELAAAAWTEDPDHWRNPWSAAARRSFARVPQPVYAERVSGRRYAAVLSGLLWRPLNAADAELRRDSPGASAGCCLLARRSDWLRVAELFIADGVFEAERVLPAGWVELILQNDGRGVPQPVWQPAPDPPAGPEQLLAPGMIRIDGARGTRLWMLPRYRLAILLASDRAPAGPTDDTTLPNAIVRGIVNRPAQRSGATDLNSLVPGH